MRDTTTIYYVGKTIQGTALIAFSPFWLLATAGSLGLAILAFAQGAVLGGVVFVLFFLFFLAFGGFLLRVVLKD